MYTIEVSLIDCYRNSLQANFSFVTLIISNMIDLKVVNSVLGQLEEERGIPSDKIIEAIETALATAYKKEWGKRGQIVRAIFDKNTGDFVGGLLRNKRNSMAQHQVW